MTPQLPQPKDLSGDELAREVARARDLPVRRQAAALLLLELAHGDGLFDVDDVSDDVNAVLQPVRMSLL